jgi:hypothetical protein
MSLSKHRLCFQNNKASSAGPLKETRYSREACREFRRQVLLVAVQASELFPACRFPFQSYKLSNTTSKLTIPVWRQVRIPPP